MNVRKFTARTSREALALVKQAFGSDAVVLSNKIGARRRRGAGDGARRHGPDRTDRRDSAPRTVARPPVPQPQQAQQPQQPAAVAARQLCRPFARQEPSFGGPEVQSDVEQLAMSTLSFQDYVRERVLRRRQAELTGQPDPVGQQAQPARQARPAPAPQQPAANVAGRCPRPARPAAPLRPSPRCRPSVPHRRRPAAPISSPAAPRAAGAARRDPHPHRPRQRSSAPCPSSATSPPLNRLPLPGQPNAKCSATRWTWPPSCVRCGA